MHFVIMGCGRVGASLAASLDADGHTVAVIDKDADAFHKLGEDFSGVAITGIGFDRDILTKAKTDEAYAFAAVSSGDNSNILAARVARETFGVKNVAARIYDPRRAQIYERLGIPTVATVRWTAEQMMRRLIPHGAVAEYREPSGHLVLAKVHINKDWITRTVGEIDSAIPGRVTYITRLGRGIIPTETTLTQEDDLIHIMAHKDNLETVINILDHPYTEQEATA